MPGQIRKPCRRIGPTVSRPRQGAGISTTCPNVHMVYGKPRPSGRGRSSHHACFRKRFTINTGSADNPLNPRIWDPTATAEPRPSAPKPSPRRPSWTNTIKPQTRPTSAPSEHLLHPPPARGLVIECNVPEARGNPRLSPKRLILGSGRRGRIYSNVNIAVYDIIDYFIRG